LEVTQDYILFNEEMPLIQPRSLEWYIPLFYIASLFLGYKEFQPSQLRAMTTAPPASALCLVVCFSLSNPVIPNIPDSMGFVGCTVFVG